MGLKDLGKQVKKERKDINKTEPEKFLEAIDSYLLHRPGRGHSFSIKPSGYFRCMRKVWYETLEYPNKGKTYPRSQRIMDVGTAVHLYIQDDILAGMAAGGAIKFIPADELIFEGIEGIEFVKHDSSDVEHKVRDRRYTNKYPISYMVDGAFEFGDIRYIFEFKTINSKDFEYLIEPKRDHIAQGAVYALSTGIKKVMFLYMNKDTQHFKCFIHEYTETQLDWARDRIQEIDSSLINLELPEKDCGEDCKWCGYKDLCDKDGIAKEYKLVEGFKVYKK